MEDQINNQIDAAEKLAALYDEDDRPDIKTDVMNSFYAGIAFAAKMKHTLNDNETLFLDLKTDEEKFNFFLSGRGYATGVIALAIQNDVAMAYKRCAEFKKYLTAEPSNFCQACGKKTPAGSIHTCTPP